VRDFCSGAYSFLYLVVIMDWVSRVVLAWRLSNTLGAEFCVEARVRDADARCRAAIAAGGGVMCRGLNQDFTLHTPSM
jgi:hypothetical protein